MHRLIACTALLIACATAHAQDDAIPRFKDVDSMEARVQGCVTCHGHEGQGAGGGYFPRIAGKPAAYLYTQLVAFRDGRRKYPPMNYLVAYLPDAYLKEIAQHFAKQRPAFAPKVDMTATNPATVARGKTIVTAGDGAKQLPACTACHGAGLTGMEPGIPGLVGLHPAYIAAQLTRWRVGDRRATEPDCMKRIASRLSESDVAAVSVYLSMQDPPRDSSPGAPNPARMPMACGTNELK